MTGQAGQLLPAEVPHSRDVVLTAGEDASALSVEGYCQDRALVTGQHECGRRRRDRPDAHRAVVGGRRHQRPVRTEHSLRDAIPMAGEDSFGLSGFGVPYPNHVVPSPRRNAAPIATEGCRHGGAHPAAHRRVPPPEGVPDDVLLEGDGDQAMLADVPVGGHPDDNRGRHAQARENDRALGFLPSHVEHRQGPSVAGSRRHIGRQGVGRRQRLLRPLDRVQGARRDGQREDGFARAGPVRVTQGQFLSGDHGSQRRQRPSDDERAPPRPRSPRSLTGARTHRAAGT